MVVVGSGQEGVLNLELVIAESECQQLALAAQAYASAASSPPTHQHQLPQLQLQICSSLFHPIKTLLHGCLNANVLQSSISAGPQDVPDPTHHSYQQVLEIKSYPLLVLGPGDRRQEGPTSSPTTHYQRPWRPTMVVGLLPTTTPQYVLESGSGSYYPLLGP